MKSVRVCLIVSSLVLALSARAQTDSVYFKDTGKPWIYMEQLDDTIKKYYLGVIKKFDFRNTENLAHVGMGALRTYQNQDFKLRIVNDRGYIDGEIGSLNDSAEYFGIIQFFWLFMTEATQGSLSKEKRKQIILLNLSNEEAAKFIDKYYDKIVVLLAPRNYSQIKDKLIRLAREQHYYKFGRPMPD